jgi:oxygen-independent coproporphyrinogen-3 oxidase
MSLEANPTDAEAQHFAALAQAGVDRLSLGYRAWTTGRCVCSGRNHGADEAARAARLARRLFEQLSIDLIYALPDQTPAGAGARRWRPRWPSIPTMSRPIQLTIEAGHGVRAGRCGAARWSRRMMCGVRTCLAPRQTVPLRHRIFGLRVSTPCPRAGGEWRGTIWSTGGARPMWGRPRRAWTPEGRNWLAGDRSRPDACGLRGNRGRQGLGHAERDLLTPEARAEERLLMGLRIADGVRWDEIAALELLRPDRRGRDLQAHGLLRAGRERLQATPRDAACSTAILRDTDRLS